MEAKDTAMDDRELALLKDQHIKETGTTRPDIREYVFAVRDRQAEISFKAGRKEAVEWIKEHAVPVITEKDKVLLKFLGGSQPNALMLDIEEWKQWQKPS